MALSCEEGFTVTGEVNLDGARISGYLNLRRHHGQPRRNGLVR